MVSSYHKNTLKSQQKIVHTLAQAFPEVDTANKSSYDVHHQDFYQMSEIQL